MKSTALFLTTLKNKLSPLVFLVRSNADKVWTKFQTLSLRERRIAVAAFLVMIFIGVDRGVVEPLQSNLKMLNTKIQAQEKQSLRQFRSVTMKPQIDEAYLRLVENIDAAKASDEEVRSAMLHDIESFARQENMNLSEVKPQVSDERGSFKEFSVRMQVDGTLRELVRFFMDLIKTRKLYYVASFRITPHPDDMDKIRANVSIGRGVFSTEV